MRNFFIVFALAVVGGAAYLLFLDFHQPVQAPQAPQSPPAKQGLGLVEASRNDSKREGFGEQSWNSLSIGGSVFSKDTVKTGDDSNAAIRLTDGTLIQEKSNTELFLEKSGPGTSVILKSGEINIENSTSTVQFATRGAIILGEGATLQMMTDTGGKSKIVDQKGQIKIFDKNNKTQALVENDTAALADGVLVNIQKSVVPVQKTVAAPRPIPIPVPASPPTPKINHKPVAKPTAVKVEPKKSPTPVATPSPSPTPIDGKTPTFIIMNPKDQIELTRDLTMEHPDPILFQWKVTRPLPGPLTLNVSNDPQFSDPIVVNNVKKTSVLITLKKEGIYYWSLSSQSADGSGLEISPAITFNLKSAGALTAPIAISPKDSETIETDEARPVTFKWKASKNATEYHIVLKRTDPASKEQFIVADQVLHEIKFTSEPLEIGAYSWMVTAKDIKDREKGFSREMSFNIGATIQIAPPKLKEPVVK